MLAVTEKAEKLEAEIVPDCDPQWHAISVYSANVAAAHLVARRFGIYDPLIKRRHKNRQGRMITRVSRFFPGYLFIRVWDIRAHWRRILACPGVQKIMADGEIPFIVPDEFISRVLSEEARLEADIAHIAYRKPRRRPRSSNKIKPRKSAAISLASLDDESRNQVLRSQLQLPRS